MWYKQKEIFLESGTRLAGHGIYSKARKENITGTYCSIGRIMRFGPVITECCLSVSPHQNETF